MLIGTLLLGLLMGFLIWGWLRKKVTLLQKRSDKYQRISDLHQVQIVDLTTRLIGLREQMERAETKVSLAEYRWRKAQEDLEAAKEQIATSQQEFNEQLEGRKQVTVPSDMESEVHEQPARDADQNEPTLADIFLAMEKGTLDKTAPKAEEPNQDTLLHEAFMRGASDESLDFARKIFDFPVEADDLKVIFGIDQKMEEILHRAGVITWSDLALCRLPDLRRIIEEAGPRYRSHDPKTWAIQARMAAKGEWKKLQAYQEALAGGGE